MADENHMLNLRFATFQPLYCQQQKSTLPKELQLSEKVLSLVNNPLPSYSFTKEYELIASYSDIAAKKGSSTPIPSGTSVAATTVAPSSSGAVSSGSVMNHTSGTSYDPVMVSIHNNPPMSNNMMSAANQAAADEAASHEALTVAMMSETGKERDVCYFFLESVNWDLSQAIEMLKSVDIK